MKNVISTAKAPVAIGPYSQAIEVNGFIYLSGQLGLDPISGNIVEGGVEAQTRRAMENILAILDEVDLEIAHVVKTTIFLTDMADFAKVNGFTRVFLWRTSQRGRPCRSQLCLRVGRWRLRWWHAGRIWRLSFDVF